MPPTRWRCTRISIAALALLLLTGGALAADRHKLDVDPETEDGILLQRIEQEPTLPRKQALLEKYVAEYPKTASIAWVYEQLLNIYMDAMQWDRVLATADGLLAADPNDLDSAHGALKAAEAMNDTQLRTKYAELAWDLASRTLQAPKPADPDDLPEWTKQVTFAHEVLDYSEYTLASLAAVQTDDLKRAELTLALQERNPQSKFLALTKKATVIELASLNPQKALQLAAEGLATDPDNVDFLMTIADHDMSLEHNLPQVLSYALRILELLQGKPQPARHRAGGMGGEEGQVHRLGELAGGRGLRQTGPLRIIGPISADGGEPTFTTIIACSPPRTFIWVTTTMRWRAS